MGGVIFYRIPLNGGCLVNVPLKPSIFLGNAFGFPLLLSKGTDFTTGIMFYLSLGTSQQAEVVDTLFIHGCVLL